MIIQKDYRFYAAHRNEELTDKCRNLHGHRYGIRCLFEEDWVADNRYFGANSSILVQA